MPTPLRIALFLSVATALDVLAHLYLFRRLVRRPRWSSPLARRMLGSAIVGLGLFLPVGLFSVRFLPRAVGQPVAWLTFTWMGMLFYLLLVFGVTDFVRWATRRLRQAAMPPVSPERRRFLEQSATMALAGGGTALTAIGLGEGLGETDIKEVEVKLERLPSTLSGLTVAQLSDIHIGPLLGRRWLAGVVERTNQLKPDLVVITGDLVDGSVAELMEHVAELGKLRSRWGTYFVTGNHEYYSGASAWAEALRRLGITVLSNQHVTLGDAGGRIELVGIDDWSVYRPQAHTLGERLKSKLDPELERILLAHQPRAVGEAARFDAGLQLSGHTHGGQLFPFSGLVALTTPYVAGLYAHDPRTQIYVSRGTGFWGPPMRLLAPAEITKIVLG